MSVTAYQSLARRLGMNERDQGAALSEYMANGGVNLDPEVTAWCAGAVQAALAEAGIEGTGSLAARSYLDWGQPVDQPEQGDLAVFSRGAPGSGQGHVGFFDGYNPDGSIRVLGGNQGDGVSIDSFGANALLGFRRAPETGADGLGGYAPPAPTNALSAMQARMAVPQTSVLDPSLFMSRRRFG